MSKRLAIVDHFDSFVHTLAGYCRALSVDCHLIRHDAALLSELKQADAILLSPGPGHPSEAKNSLNAVENLPDTPILGICLGHQIIGSAYGATIARAAPVHGRTSRIHHTGKRAFLDIPSPTPLARYHSLVVTQTPQNLIVDAWTRDRTIMAVSHKESPHWGLQIHPEATESSLGIRLLANFLRAAEFEIDESKATQMQSFKLPITSPKADSEQMTTTAPSTPGSRPAHSDFFAEPIQPAYPLPTTKEPR